MEFFRDLEFDRENRLISDEYFSLARIASGTGNYDLSESSTKNMLLVQATNGYNFYYPSERQMVIVSLDNHALSREEWKYQDGQLQEYKKFAGKEPELVFAYYFKYKSDSLLVALNKVDDDLKTLFSVRMIYSEEGSLLQACEKEEGGKETYQLYEHDNYGNLTKHINFESAADLHRNHYEKLDGLYVRKKSHPEEKYRLKARYSAFVYDSMNRLLVEKKYTKKGKFKEQVVLSYNGEGLISTKGYFKGEKEKTRTVFLYDKEGRYTSITYNHLINDDNLLDIEKLTFIYDDRGNVTRMQHSKRLSRIIHRMDIDYTYWD